MSPIDRIRLHETTFTQADRKVEHFVLDHLDIVASYTIVEVAEKAGVSKSALLRFCKKLGYSGYSEFKFESSRFLLSGAARADEPSDSSSFIEAYVACIQAIPQVLTDAKTNAIARAIADAQSIKLFGIHESGLSAQYLAYRLAALGVDSEPLNIAGNFETKAGFSRKGDLSIFISVSGVSGGIMSAAAISAARGADCILITMNDKVPNRDDYQEIALLPSFDIDRTVAFMDSQSIILIALDLVISRIASLLRER